MGSRVIPVRFQSSFRAISLGLKEFSILFFFFFNLNFGWIRKDSFGFIGGFMGSRAIPVRFWSRFSAAVL